MYQSENILNIVKVISKVKGQYTVLTTLLVFSYTFNRRPIYLTVTTDIPMCVLLQRVWWVLTHPAAWYYHTPAAPQSCYRCWRLDHCHWWGRSAVHRTWWRTPGTCTYLCSALVHMSWLRSMDNKKNIHDNIPRIPWLLFQITCFSSTIRTQRFNLRIAKCHFGRFLGTSRVNNKEKRTANCPWPEFPID